LPLNRASVYTFHGCNTGFRPGGYSHVLEESTPYGRAKAPGVGTFSGNQPVAKFPYPMLLVHWGSPVHSTHTMRIAVLLICAALSLKAQPADWTSLNKEGVRLIDEGKYAEAEVLLRSALSVANGFGESDPRYWITLSNLALAIEQNNITAEAETLLRRCLSLRERYSPVPDAAIAVALTNLATLLHSAGRDVEADPLLRRAILIATQTRTDPILANALNVLGLVLTRLGETSRAEPVLRRSLALFEKINGANSLEAAKVLNNLAALYFASGDVRKAVAAESRAVPIYEEALPANHPVLAAALNNMFSILAGANRLDEAEPYLRRAMAIAEKSDTGSERCLLMQSNLATLEAGRGRLASAAKLFEAVIAEQEKLLGPNHPDVAQSYSNYAAVERRLHRNAEAKRAEQRAEGIMKSFR
jgi:tetratricopeptide (TPR) repeat protein